MDKCSTWGKTWDSAVWFSISYDVKNKKKTTGSSSLYYHERACNVTIFWNYLETLNTHFPATRGLFSSRPLNTTKKRPPLAGNPPAEYQEKRPLLPGNPPFEYKGKKTSANRKSARRIPGKRDLRYQETRLPNTRGKRPLVAGNPPAEYQGKENSASRILAF